VKSEVLFVQFWYVSRRYGGARAFHNGFSHVYNQCENIGDFYWVELPEGGQLPIKNGTVYVSVNTYSSLFCALSWSYEYPDVRFVVGGPLIVMDPNLKGLVTEKPLRNNIEFSSKTAEEKIFAQSFRNTSWNIDLPPGSDKCVVSFTNLTGCYWNKCIFCCYDKRGPHYSSVDNLKLDSDREWMVWLTASSTTPEYMVNEFHKLEPNVEYHVHLRADVYVLNVLEQVLARCKGDLVFYIGTECPSNHVLQYMKKGTTVETNKKIIELIAKYGHKFRINVILGWDVLTENDVQEVKEFSQHIGSLPNGCVRLHWLCYPNRDLYHEGVLITSAESGPYKFQEFFAKPNKKQMELNFKLKEIYEENFHVVGCSNVKKLEEIYYNNLD